MAKSRSLFYILLLWISATILNTNAANTAIGDRKVVVLNRDNYDELTQSKTVVFVKFFAPWCGHSKKMKADWQRLAEEYNISDGETNMNGENNRVGGVLVAEVDCTEVANGGKALCHRLRIDSFPTLKYGDPTNLEEYNGKRSLKEISAFAREHLLPMLCSPTTLELCADNAARAAMKKYAGFTAKQLKSSILAAEQKLKAAERNFKSNVDRLTKGHNDAERMKRTAIKRVVSGGDLNFMRQTISMLKDEYQSGIHQKQETDKRSENDGEL